MIRIVPGPVVAGRCPRYLRSRLSLATLNRVPKLSGTLNEAKLITALDEQDQWQPPPEWALQLSCEQAALAPGQLEASGVAI